MESPETVRIQDYFAIASQQLEIVLAAQKASMGEVARRWADGILADRLLYLFGSGHSRFIAGELTWRAGGLAPAVRIEDPSDGAAERLEGYATTFMSQYDIQGGDIVVVISNSGINATPIEAALYGREKGATVIALTSMAHSRETPTRHSSGSRLFELADIVLDTMTVRGDAVVDLPGQAWRVAPTSTLISVAILNAIVAQTAQLLLDAGVMPPVLLSANVPEGDEHNRAIADRYWRRLTQFPRLGSLS